MTAMRSGTTPAAAGGQPASSAPLRVAFDHDIFVIQEHGGISRYFTRLVEHLPEFGVDARIIAPLYFTNALRDLAFSRTFGRHVSWSPRKVRAGRLLGALAHKPTARAFGAKIVHETYYLPERLAPRGCGLVTTIYDMIFEMNPHIPDAARVIANKRAAIERADRIICISEHSRRDLIRFYPEVEDRTCVIHLAFDPIFAEATPRPSSHPRPYILYVGMRRDYKNFSGLLDAYAGSKPLREAFDLICVGQQFNPEEAALIGSLGLAGKVHRRVAHHDADLANFYRHAVLFAFPSLYEGFGIPPLEAMAAGCPVVAMNISSVPEVCGAAAEYAQSDAPESLREALENVALSPNRASALRAAGRERLTHFSWRKCAEETAEVYKAMI